MVLLSTNNSFPSIEMKDVFPLLIDFFIELLTETSNHLDEILIILSKLLRSLPKHHTETDDTCLELIHICVETSLGIMQTKVSILASTLFTVSYTKVSELYPEELALLKETIDVLFQNPYYITDTGIFLVVEDIINTKQINPHDYHDDIVRLQEFIDSQYQELCFDQKKKFIRFSVILIDNFFAECDEEEYFEYETFYLFIKDVFESRLINDCYIELIILRQVIMMETVYSDFFEFKIILQRYNTLKTIDLMELESAELLEEISKLIITYQKSETISYKQLETEM